MGFRLDNAYSELPNQYVDSQGILQLLEAIFTIIEDTDILLADLLTKRDLNSAEGVWLDMIGGIVGYPRPAGLILDNNIFTFKTSPPGADDPDKSFGDTATPGAGGYFQGVHGVNLTDGTLVDDDTYRIFLKAKIASKEAEADVSLVELDNFISETFGIDFITTEPAACYVEVRILTPDPHPAVRYAIKEFAPITGGVDLYVI